MRAWQSPSKTGWLAGSASPSRRMVVRVVRSSTSGGGVVPVAQINDRSFGNGRPGPTGTSLRARYFERLKDPDFRTEITYDPA